MKVYIVGEDDVTKSIIRKVLEYCSEKVQVLSEIPARGGQIKSKMSEFNRLSESFPVILLMDLDAISCAPKLLSELRPVDNHKHFVINIAVDEGEAWLMADREGFAKYFGVDINRIPESKLSRQGGRTLLREMDFKYKSSLFLTRELIPTSKNQDFVSQFTPKKGAVKGPEYNSGIVPFINGHWNIGNACANSDSLTRMIKRIKKLVDVE